MNRLTLVAALTVIATSTAFAAQLPAGSKGQPDFSGMWLQDQGILFSDPTPKHHSGSHPGWDDSVNPPPLNAEYQKRYDDNKAAIAKNSKLQRLYSCDPPGMPRLMANPFPMEIVQRPDKLLMLFEYKSQIRRVYLDGREHPSEDDFDAAFDGHSVGRWEGDTLVIDTALISNRPGKLIQVTGIEHSDEMRVVERMRLLGPDKLELEITMIDPKVFTKPWVALRSFSRKPLKVNVPEYLCLASELIGELNPAPK